MKRPRNQVKGETFVSLTIRLPSAIHADARQIAFEDERSLNHFIERAVEEYNEKEKARLKNERKEKKLAAS